MKPLKFTLLTLVASVFSASFAADYYWNGPTSGWATKANWSTTPEVFTELTGDLPGAQDSIHVFYSLSRDGPISTYTGTAVALVSLANGTHNYDKLIYDTPVAPSGTYVLDETDPENPSKTYTGGAIWQLYAANTVINLNLIKVATEIPADNGNTLYIRKTDSGTNLELNIKNVEAYGGNIHLGGTTGSAGKGQHLTSLTIGEDTLASRGSVTVDINGTESAFSTFRIVSNNYTHYGKINIKNGEFYFAIGASAGTYTPQDSLSFTEDITLFDNAKLSFASTSGAVPTAISLEKVIVTDNAKNASINVFSSYQSSLKTLVLGNTAADTPFKISTARAAALVIDEVVFNESNINTNLVFGTSSTNLRIKGKITLAGVAEDLPIVSILNYSTSSTGGTLALDDVDLSAGASLFAGNWTYEPVTSSANKFETLTLGKLAVSGLDSTFRGYAQDVVLNDEVSITDGAKVAFGAWGKLNGGTGTDYQYRLGYFTVNSDILISGADTSFTLSTTSMTLASGKTITVKEGTSAEFMVGTTDTGLNIDGRTGNINIESGGKLTIRRSSGNPIYNLENLTVASGDETDSLMCFGNPNFRIGGVNIDSVLLSYIQTDAEKTAGISNLEIYTEIDSVSRIKITSLTVEEGAEGRITAPANLEITNLTTQLDSMLTIRGSNASVLGNFTNLSKRLTLGTTNFTVYGNMVNKAEYQTEFTTSGLSISRSEGSTFVVHGEFQNDGRVNLGYSSGASPWEYSFAGITSTESATSSKRIYTTYTSCGANIKLTGAGTYVYGHRIHDFGENGVFDESYTGKIGIKMDGLGKQYLAGDNYYRGDTIISKGSLYLRADGTGIKDASKRRGVADIYLNGGRFGAVGAVTASDLKTNRIGTVMADNFYFDNKGILVFDLDLSMSGASDKLIIAGLFTKGEFSETGKFMFEFVCDGIIAQNLEYEIIKFGDSDFVVSDFDFVATDLDGNSKDLRGFFTLRDSALYFTAIPEPSVYAAILGICALFFAVYRRR